jgi:hypothetical protein
MVDGIRWVWLWLRGMGWEFVRLVIRLHFAGI